MFNWKYINWTYIYDGSFEGLLTIVFDCYINKKIPNKIVSEEEYMLNILDTCLYVKTNYEKSKRIVDGIVKNISYDVLYNSYNAFLSSKEFKEINILKYILNGFVIGPKIDTMLSIDYVLAVQKLKKNVLMEAHRLKGLVRLMEIKNNLFYASIHPDNNIIENVGKFLIKRFPAQNLILHDKNRNIAMLYNQKEYSIIPVPCGININNFSENELNFQKLWKTFFNSISIKERTNKRLQMQFMPKRYWQDLIEI
ncbi:MAG: TIGR03915 family putative DNA repair protein [Clostridia bacterium]|nr:TIGR03915 family putative DNA repair protein [Clostridia bacterium]